MTIRKPSSTMLAISSDSSSADVSELTYNVWMHEGTKY